MFVLLSAARIRSFRSGLPRARARARDATRSNLSRVTVDGTPVDGSSVGPTRPDSGSLG